MNVRSMTDQIYENLMAWPVDKEVSIAKTVLIVRKGSFSVSVLDSSPLNNEIKCSEFLQ